MTEQQAEIVASALGGEAWNSGGDIWLVVFRRSDGKVIALSDESLVVYDSAGAMMGGEGSQSVPLH